MKKITRVKKGVSLIVLVITILVIIVLAGAVILTVTKNNPLTSANEAVFKSDIKNFETELSVSVATKLGEGMDTSEINADKNSTPNITEYIGSIEGKKNYLDILEVVEGELIYIGSNDKEKVWAEEAGIKVKNQILRISNVNISNVTGNSADIEVVTNNESLVRGYKLSLDNGATYGSEQVSKIFNLTGLTGERNYDIKVKAVKPDNTELESSSYRFTTTPLYGTNGNTEMGVAKVNKPELKGMTPVRWEGTREDINITRDSSNWYAYIAGDNRTDSKNSKWANAKTQDGSYFVWIPRYAYKITEKPTTTGNVSGKIEVVFLKETTNKYDSDGRGNMRDAVADGYIVHPAFTFGTKELTGIWVGKYEISSVEGNGNSSALDNVTTKTIQIKPNVASWRYIGVATIFENCYTMASKPVYGFSNVADGDTHMMKNSEWGCVAYLAHSQYGRNGVEVTINNSSEYITGAAGSSPTDTTTSANGTYAYNTLQGQLASTTGNAYGIYDMSGGAFEYVAGNLAGYKESAGSQPNFDRIYSDSVLKNKFFDFYNYSGISGADGREANYQANRTKKGDALYETSIAGVGAASWFKDESYFVASDGPWFRRGGHFNGGSIAGVFSFHFYTGISYSSFSSRVVLAP